MEKLEFLRTIKNRDSRDLREADVRYQIIDNLFKQVLCWPDDKVKCEDHVHSGYIDYTLYNKNSIPVLLIEAKREGLYFELPNNNNKHELRRSIVTEELLTDGNIRDALFK